MLDLLPLAARNVMRNKRRTAITLSGVLLGVAATVFLGGFAGGFIQLLTALVSEGRMGAIQVHKKGYLDEDLDPLKMDLPQDAAFISRLKGVPGVTAVSPRITFEAMLSNGSEGTVVYVTAMDPALEALVCPRRWDAVEGGRFIPDRPEDVLVGRVLLAGLGAQAGSPLLITASMATGATNALDVRVLRSLGNTDILQSKRRMEMTLEYAQTLLAMQGRVTEYALAMDEDADLDKVAALVKTAVGPDHDVHTWPELASDLADVFRLIAFIMSLVVLMLALLVLSGVANTMLMAVHERTREIGTMMAMGMKRRRVMLSIVLEAGVLGVMGGVLGAILGYILVQLVHATGFPLKPPGSDVDNYLRPLPSVLFAIISAVGCAVGAVLAALYPARRAARLTPVEALRND